jgi:flavodoxin I
MKKTCVIYGSSTGTCEDIAKRIASKLDNAEVVDAAKLNVETIAAYDNLLLGTSTWGAGEMQDDWYDGVKALKAADLNGKTIALFGCGDSESYCDTFCGGMAELYKAVEGKGANLVGMVSADDYNFEDSEAVIDGEFVGLALDEMNESDKTDERIDAWIESFKAQL